HAIAEQAPDEAQTVDVIADALQGLVYAQRFRRTDAGWEPADELRIEPFAAWAERAGDGWVSGPGVDGYAARIRGKVVPAESRAPGLEALYRVGLRLMPLTAAEVMRLEPLYLRPSSAEEKAAKR